MINRQRFSVICGILLVCLSGLSRVYSQDDKALYKYGNVLVSLNEGKLYDRTVKALNDYLIKCPEESRSAEVQFNLANFYSERKKQDLAFISYLKIVTLYPDSPNVPKAIVKAKEAATKAKKLSPIKEKLYSFVDSPNTETEFQDRFFQLLLRLRELVYPKFNDALIPECLVFLETFPEYPQAHLVAEWIGDMHREKREYWEAMAWYLHVIHLYADSDRIVECQLKVGELFSGNLKKYEAAVGTFESIIRSDTDSLSRSEAQWNLALVLEKKIKDYGRAVKHFQNLVDQFPFSTHCLEALTRKADLQISKLKLYQRGIDTYQQVVEKYPENPEAAAWMVQVAEVYEKKIKDFDKAVESYMSVSDKYPSYENSAKLLFKAAEIAEKKLEDKIWALGIYRQVVDKYGSDRIAEKARRKIESLKE